MRKILLPPSFPTRRKLSTPEKRSCISCLVDMELPDTADFFSKTLITIGAMIANARIIGIERLRPRIVTIYKMIHTNNAMIIERTNVNNIIKKMKASNGYLYFFIY